MKRIKLLAVILSVIMMIGLVIPMTAMADDPTGSITIEDDPRAGTIYKAFKIFDLTWNGKAPDEGGAYSYTLNPRYNAIASLATPYLALPSPSDAQAREFADAVWAIIKDMTPELEGLANDEGWAELELGYYLVSSVGNNPDGGSPVTAAVSLTTNAPDVKIKPKVDFPTIDKNQSLTAGDYAKTKLNASIGDTIYYRLDSEVPNMYNYTSYIFTVKDTMSVGLTFNEDVVVLVDGEPYDHWTYAENPSPQTFHIVFTPSEFVKLRPTAPIVITYTALLNDDAVIRVGPNTNTVFLEYSNNPYPAGNGSTGSTPPITVEVWTYDFRILKHNEAEEPLAGAEFILKATENGAVIPVVRVGAAPADLTTAAVYRPALAGETPVDTMITPPSGLILVQGLAPGTYYLEETEAPDGYNALVDEEEVLVSETELVTSPILNKTGTQLPGVGGIGRTIFYIAGVALMFGAGIVLIVRRKVTAK